MKHNGFEIITGTHIWGGEFAIARHPEHKTIVTDHRDTEEDAVEMIRELIDAEIGTR